MKCILNKVYINDTNKDGQPLTNKKGEPYTMVNIEYTSGTITGKASMYCGGKFGAKDVELAETWKEGDEVNLVFEQNGAYTNFHVPNKSDLLEERVTVLEKAVKQLIALQKNG